MMNLLFVLLCFQARATEIEWPGETLKVTCDDGKSYSLRIKNINDFKRDDIINDWFNMIINTKCNEGDKKNGAR